MASFPSSARSRVGRIEEPSSSLGGELVAFEIVPRGQGGCDDSYLGEAFAGIPKIPHTKKGGL